MHTQNQSEQAWRYNHALIRHYKRVGPDDIKSKINEFETTLNRYAEQTLDWDTTVGSIVADADDAASRASANQALDSFNRIRSGHHNHLIKLTTELDSVFMQNNNERFCNYPMGMSIDTMRQDNHRKNITDAAFSYYVQTHPNDRLDNKDVQWVRKNDMELAKSGKIDFQSELSTMTKNFNTLDSDYKMIVYDDAVFGINVSPQAKSNFKLYSPMELAVAMNENNEYQDSTPYEQSVIISSLAYAEENSSRPFLREKSPYEIITHNKLIKQNLIDLIGPDYVHDDVLQMASQTMMEYELNHNNIDVQSYVKHSTRLSTVMKEPLATLEDGLNDLNNMENDTSNTL